MGFRKHLIPILKPIQKWIRRRTRPISTDEAEEKKELFSKLYFLASFSLFSFLCYVTFRNEIDFGSGKDENKPHNFIFNVLSSGEKVRYIRIQDFEKVDDKVMDVKDLRRWKGNDGNNDNDSNNNTSNSNYNEKLES